MLYLPVEVNPLFLITIVSIGFFGSLVSALVKPVIKTAGNVIDRLGNPNRDIFGRKKDPSTPDPMQEGLRAAVSTATGNLQSRQDTALSDIGLAPKPIKPTNIALVMVVIAVVFMVAKK